MPALVNFQRISAGFLRREPHAVGIVVLHVRVLLHHLGVLEILFGGGQQEFVILGAGIADHEADLLAALHLDP